MSPVYGNVNRKLGTIVIGGGSGFIGTALGNKLRELGYNVMNVSRKPGPYTLSWSDLETKGLPSSIAVVSLAGQNVLDPTRRWTPGFKQNVWASRVKTTKALAIAIANSEEPPKVFTSISGVGYYRPSLTEEYTENSKGGNFDFLSRLCTDWECATNLPENFPTRKAIIRSGVVLGRNGGMIKQIFLPFYLGLGGPIGSGTHFMPWIHLTDIVNLFVYTIENEKVDGILNGVAPQIVTNAEFTKAFAKALWRPAFIPLPIPILNLAFSEERAKIMTEGQKVIPKRTLEMGFKYRYPDIKSACQEFATLRAKKPL